MGILSLHKLEHRLRQPIRSATIQETNWRELQLHELHLRCKVIEATMQHAVQPRKPRTEARWTADQFLLENIISWAN